MSTKKLADFTVDNLVQSFGTSATDILALQTRLQEINPNLEIHLSGNKASAIDIDIDIDVKPTGEWINPDELFSSPQTSTLRHPNPGLIACLCDPSQPHYIASSWDKETKTCKACGYGVCSRSAKGHWGKCKTTKGKLTKACVNDSKDPNSCYGTNSGVSNRTSSISNGFLNTIK